MQLMIPEPWLSFLRDVDSALSRPVEVHCLGGFVLSVLWGLPRPTGDVDFIEIKPSGAVSELREIAGEENSTPPRNFKEWILAMCGRGIARHFMVPYNRKIWTVDPSEMAYQWIGDRAHAGPGAWGVFYQQVRDDDPLLAAGH